MGRIISVIYSNKERSFRNILGRLVCSGCWKYIFWRNNYNIMEIIEKYFDVANRLRATVKVTEDR